MHRSGTWLLAHQLSEHPQISALTRPGGWQPEGQHEQTVYPAAHQHRGMGNFGFDPEAHLTEESPLVSEGSRARLMAEWSALWDLRRPVLLEKSPPNLIRARFLQALFPASWFVMIMRHPVAVAYSTEDFMGTKLSHGRLVRHWIACHETFAADRPRLARVHVVRYEDLVADGPGVLAGIDAFLGLEPHEAGERAVDGRNDAHRERWAQDPDREGIVGRLEGVVNRFGYSLVDW